MNTEFQKRFLEARRDMFRAAALDNRNTRLGCALIQAAKKDLPRFTETEFTYYQAGARWPYGEKHRIHFYTGAAGQQAVNLFKSLAAELGDVLPAIQDWLPIVNQESMRGATGQIRWVFDVAMARSTAEVSHPATPHEAAQSLHGKWKPDFFQADIEDMFTSSADTIDIILENMEELVGEDSAREERVKYEKDCGEFVLREQATNRSARLSPLHQGDLQTPQQFTGGVLVFFSDRVDLCGVDICSGPRSTTKRRILDCLRKKRSNGNFISYSSKELAKVAELKGGQNAAAGFIRDLRDDIVESLRSLANLECGRSEVIRSRGPGYRFADCLSVQDGDDSETTEISSTTPSHSTAINVIPE